MELEIAVLILVLIGIMTSLDKMTEELSKIRKCLENKEK